MAAIKSAQTASGKRVQLGSKAAAKAAAAGDSFVSGTGKNLTSKDIKGIGGGYTDKPSTVRDKRAAEAEGTLLPYQEAAGAAVPSVPPVGATPSTEAPTAPQAPSGAQTGQLSYEQAQKNLAGGGLQGSALTAAQGSLAAKYQQAFQSVKQSGAPVPTNGGQAKSALAGVVAPEQNTSAVDSYISTDPGVNNLMKSITDLLNPPKQTSTLLQDYKKLYKESGLDQINEELIDADTVINGTEDDIRNEIQTAGGFGTESQVQAMALARNKGLLKRYNQLVQMKTDATNQLNTLSSLNAQDKQMAQTRLTTQIDTMFQLANFQQQAQNNIREGYKWLGASALYEGTKNDPKQLSNMEKILGIPSGSLASKAMEEQRATALDIAAKQAAINNANKRDTQVVDVGGRKILIDSQTGQEITEVGGTSGVDATAASRTQDTISTINSLTKNVSATGANPLARFDPFNAFTGKQENFIADVEQLRGGLTLEKLASAKGQGVTFGALSDGERQLVASAATKIGSWAIVDKNGKVTGYKVSDKDLKNELSKIGNYAKLDALKQGADPTSIGVQIIDGKYFTQNWDGTVTQIK